MGTREALFLIQLKNIGSSQTLNKYFGNPNYSRPGNLRNIIGEPRNLYI